MLELRQVAKSYKDFELEDISFRVEPGEIAGLIGRNGAGKTTTIRLIMNMIERSQGEIKVAGFDNITEEIMAKKCIGYVSDDDYLVPNAHISQYESLFAVAYENFDKKKLKEYITKWKLPYGKSFRAYSKGMKIKAMLALALSHNPKILILDEPTAGLDPVSRMEILELFRDFVADGEHSVLFSTHITSDLDKVADRIIYIDEGKVIENLSTDMLLEKYVMVAGEEKSFEKYKDKLIGAKKNSMGFSGLALRSDVTQSAELQLSQPNIEDIMVHYAKGKADGDDYGEK